MKVSVKKRNTGFEGIVQMPNFATTTLEKKDGTTVYNNVATLRRAAEQIAAKYNCDLYFINVPTKIAAKKAVN